jgi:hypothetical protein
MGCLHHIQANVRPGSIIVLHDNIMGTAMDS